MRAPVPFTTALLSVACVLAIGCSKPDDDDTFADASSFRCGETNVGLGLVGLTSVTIAGTPQVTGAFPHAFSNGEIRLSGNFTLEGNAMSATTVRIDGNRTPGGLVIEGAPPVTAADPSAEVAAAKLTNNNAKIPCVKRGNKCTSPLSDGVLSLESKDALVLPAGTYYFAGIKSSGQGSLGVNGTVRVYLGGGASFTGGTAANPTDDSLTIVSSATDEIGVAGGGTVAMHVFAPNAPVKLTGNSSFKGSLIGKTVAINGTATVTITKDVLTTQFSACQPDPTPEPNESSGGDEPDDETTGPWHPPDPEPHLP